MTTRPQPIPRLVTDAATFRQAVQALGAAAGRPGDAVLRFEEGALVIEMSGKRSSIPAEGDWPGLARVDGAWLTGDALRVLPESGVLALVYDDFRLSVGVVQVKAIWQELRPPARIELPAGATRVDLLCAWLAFSEAEIAASGLAERVEDALEARRRAEVRALRALEDLGVTAEDVEEIVERGLRRRMPEAWRER